MKITKLVHSCLLVEEDGTRLIVDPGSYSWASGLVDESYLKDIDYVVITHIHPDHCDEGFVAAIVQHSPDARWYSTQQVADKLRALGITAATRSEDDAVQFIESEHADLSPWFPEQPEHTSFLLFNELLIGGDCHTLAESHGARIFAAAITAPWGGIVSFSKAIEAMKDKPEVIVPLHDWHQNEEARLDLYAKLPVFLAQFNIEFVALENGETQEV